MLSEVVRSALERGQSLHDIQNLVGSFAEGLGFDWAAFARIPDGSGRLDRSDDSSAQHDGAESRGNSQRSDGSICNRVKTSLLPFLWAGTPNDSIPGGLDHLAAPLGDSPDYRGGSVPVLGPQGSICCIHVADFQALHAFPEKFCSAFVPLQAMAAAAAERLAELEGSVRTSLLSLRQREVLRWAIDGKTNWEVGEILGIAEDTVRQHMMHICRLLHATNRTQAVAIALLNPVLPEAEMAMLRAKYATPW